MSDEANEVKIVDVDGDELLVTWDLFNDSNGAVILEPLKAHCAVLDLAGIAALRAARDKAEAAYLARTGNPIVGIAVDSACEPSSRDRLFYKPQSLTMPNGEVRHFSPPAPFEPCPGIGLSAVGGKVVKATHPEPVQGKMSAPSEIKDLPRDIGGIAAEMKRLAMMPKVGAVEPMAGIVDGFARDDWAERVKRTEAQASTFGGLEPIAPRYPQLTDWVRAQPEGTRLLAVFRDGEPIPAVAIADNHGKQLHECYEHALYARMVGGYGYSAVWLSREVASSCEGRVPQGVSVYREGT
jgi:hypothetical protein